MSPYVERSPMSWADEYLALDWPTHRAAVSPVRDFATWLGAQGLTMVATGAHVPDAAPGVGEVIAPTEVAPE